MWWCNRWLLGINTIWCYLLVYIISFLKGSKCISCPSMHVDVFIIIYYYDLYCVVCQQLFNIPNCERGALLHYEQWNNCCVARQDLFHGANIFNGVYKVEAHEVMLLYKPFPFPNHNVHLPHLFLKHVKA